MRLLSKWKSRRKSLKRFPDGVDPDFGPVVIIGFNKTGTTSLRNLFRENDFRSIKHDSGRLPLAMIRNVASQQKLFAGYEERYGVFCDLGYFSNIYCFECNQLFRTIDHQYPNARFIYNYRPVEHWLDSRVNHRSDADQTDGTLLERHLTFYGCKNVDEIREIWRDQRGSFERQIRTYFVGRDNLLEIDIENDDVVRDISGFLKFDFKPDTWQQHRQTTELNSQ